MGLWSHAVKTALGLLVTATLAVVAAYFGITKLATVAWLKTEHDYWDGPVAITRWLVYLWATITIVVVLALVLALLLRFLLVRQASPYQVYRGDDMFGFRWEWDFNGNGDVQYVRMFCIKCFHRFQDSDFKYGTPTATGGVWALVCEHCGHSVENVPPSHELHRRVKAEGGRRIKAREWKPYKGELPD